MNNNNSIFKIINFIFWVFVLASFEIKTMDLAIVNMREQNVECVPFEYIPKDIHFLMMFGPCASKLSEQETALERKAFVNFNTFSPNQKITYCLYTEAWSNKLNSKNYFIAGITNHDEFLKMSKIIMNLERVLKAKFDHIDLPCIESLANYETLIQLPPELKEYFRVNNKLCWVRPTQKEKFWQSLHNFRKEAIPIVLSGALFGVVTNCLVAATTRLITTADAAQGALIWGTLAGITVCWTTGRSCYSDYKHNGALLAKI